MHDLRTFPRRSLWAISLVAVSCFCSCQETTEPGPAVPQKQQIRRSSQFPPPLDLPPEVTVQLETSGERAESTRKAFSETASTLGGQHEQAIAAFFQDLKRLINEEGSRKMYQLLNVDALLNVWEQQKLLSKSILENMNTDSTLEQIMPGATDISAARQVALGAPLDKIEIRHVRIIRMDTEVVAYVRLWSKDGSWRKMRWWLIQDKGKWFYYDHEFIGNPGRASTFLAMLLNIAEEKDPSVVAALKRLFDLIIKSQKQEFNSNEEAFRAFEQLDLTKLPSIFRAIRLHAMATLAFDDYEFHKAGQLAEQAALLYPDNPSGDLLIASCELELGRFDEAHKHAERYAAAVGRDSEYYAVVGAAHLAQENPKKAMDAYKKGVADDPQNGDIVLQLLRVAPPQERDVVVSHYKALKDIDSWFPYFADLLLEDSDIQALRVLLSIHQLLYPNDKNLGVVSAGLKDLSQALAFLAANAKKEGVKTTKSGLQYLVLKAGNGPSPKLTDRVTVHYRGSLINGNVFDQTYKGKSPNATDIPVSVSINGYTRAWAEVLQQMKVGGSYRMFIPSNLGFGVRGDGATVGPNATLIYEWHLLGIRKDKSSQGDKEKSAETPRVTQRLQLR